MNLQELTTKFPRGGANEAVTGRIPMSYFESAEDEIREVMREHGLRAIYRGPRQRPSRWVGMPSMTRRGNAESVLLYKCTDKARRRDQARRLKVTAKS